MDIVVAFLLERPSSGEGKTGDFYLQHHTNGAILRFSEQMYDFSSKPTNSSYISQLLYCFF